MSARKFTDEALRHTLEIFRTGGGLKEAAVAIGVHPDNLSQFIRSRGHSVPKIKRPAHNRKQLPNAQIVAEYLSGVSELDLATRYGIARGVIRSRLLDAGVQPRGQSEANIVSMSRMTSEQRQKRAEAAHDAVRGTKAPREWFVGRALTVANSPPEAHIGPGEREFEQHLTERGIDFLRQEAIDVYNLDFTIGHVAVELKINRSVLSPVYADKKRGRIKKLSECGRTPLYVSFRTVETLRASFGYILAHIDELNGLPAVPGEYWVIGCRFQCKTVFRNERGQMASKSTPKQLVNSVRKFHC
jgi:hypothetical protein